MGRGWGFALHEAMDQTGATLGPLLVAGVPDCPDDDATARRRCKTADHDGSSSRWTSAAAAEAAATRGKPR